MTDVLMKDFDTTAAGVGVISGFYFYAYTLMQIPVGILYDRYSPRKLLALANFICALGAILFTQTSWVGIACFARFAMGFGSSFAFVAVIVFVNRWFKPVYFATLIGLAQLMSSIGAVSAEAPLEVAVHYIGWKETMVYIAVFGIILGCLTFFFVHDGDTELNTQQSTWKNEWEKLCKLFQSSQTWAVGAYTFFVWSPITAFAGLWCVPFIREVYGMDNFNASLYAIIIWVAVGVASPIAGMISDYFKNRKTVLALSALLGVISSIVMIYFPSNRFMLAICLSLIGIAAGGQALSFAVVNDNNEPHFVGTASGINNMATVAGGALFQPLVGLMLKYFSDGQIINGVPHYSTATYQVAMCIVPLCFFGALIASTVFLKESYPR